MTPEILKLIREYEDARKTKQAMEARMAALSDILLEALQDVAAGEFVIDDGDAGELVAREITTTRITYDPALLRQHLPKPLYNEVVEHKVKNKALEDLFAKNIIAYDTVQDAATVKQTKSVRIYHRIPTMIPSDLDGTSTFENQV